MLIILKNYLFLFVITAHGPGGLLCHMLTKSFQLQSSLSVKVVVVFVVDFNLELLNTLKRKKGNSKKIRKLWNFVCLLMVKMRMIQRICAVNLPLTQGPTRWGRTLFLRSFRLNMRHMEGVCHDGQRTKFGVSTPENKLKFWHAP